MNRYKSEIEKIAGIKSMGKAIGRTGAGAMMGAGFGLQKGVSANEANPYADRSEKDKNLAAGAIGGALVGGAALGPGFGLAKKVGEKAMNLFKKAEMEVPTKDEKENEGNSVTNSPNDKEKRIMMGSDCGCNEKKKEYKDLIEKSAESYVVDIDCENCSYVGKPDESDGRCPQCGALGGVKPKETTHRDRTDFYNKEISSGRLYDEICEARKGLYGRY